MNGEELLGFEGFVSKGWVLSHAPYSGPVVGLVDGQDQSGDGGPGPDFGPDPVGPRGRGPSVVLGVPRVDLLVPCEPPGLVTNSILFC